MASDDGVVVTAEVPVASPPDNSKAAGAAEERARQVVSDLDAGLVSRRSSVAVKQAAKRAIRNADLARSIGRLD